MQFLDTIDLLFTYVTVCALNFIFVCFCIRNWIWDTQSRIIFLKVRCTIQTEIYNFLLLFLLLLNTKYTQRERERKMIRTTSTSSRHHSLFDTELSVAQMQRKTFKTLENHDVRRTDDILNLFFSYFVFALCTHTRILWWMAHVSSAELWNFFEVVQWYFGKMALNCFSIKIIQNVVNKERKIEQNFFWNDIEIHGNLILNIFWVVKTRILFTINRKS